MHFSEDNTVLYIKFKSKPAKDTKNCLLFLENILILSNSFRIAKATKDRSSKKFNKTNRIRIGIESLVNKENVSAETIKTLISLIRRGRLEEIDTHLGNKNIHVTATTNFGQLLDEFKKEPQINVTAEIIE